MNFQRGKFPRFRGHGRGFPLPTLTNEYAHYDTDNRDRENAGPSQLRRGKPPSKRGRDVQRSESHRLRVGIDETKEMKKELDKTLFFGFSLETKAIDASGFHVDKQAKIIPISTRVIGLTVQSMFVTLNQRLTKLPNCSVYQAYRVSLAQAEMKMMKSQESTVLRVNVDNDLFHRPRLTMEEEKILKACPINFNVIASAINAIGKFEYNQTTYYPKFAARQLPSPVSVTYSNLARVVKLLSLESTPRETRVEFYLNNPLPGAIWTGTRPTGKRRADPNLNPILANPTDFWPDDWDDDVLRNDVHAYMGLLSWASSKSLKYVNLESKIDYDGPGVKTVLVSNLCNNLRNSEVIVVNDVIDYRVMSMPVGTLSEFWSSELIDETTAYIGALQLLGEIPESAVDDPTYRVRAIENSSVRMSQNWATMFINMMG